MKPSLLVIDDHPIVRIALSSYLRSAYHGQVHNIVCADGVAMALKLIHANNGPWVVTLDLCMPGVRGVDAIQALRAADHVEAIVVVSSLDADMWEPVCLEAGADAFVPKLDDPAHVVRIVGRYVAERSDPVVAEGWPPRLTPRQAEVLRCMAEGLSNKLIARQLGIAEMTVKIHVTQILRCLRASNRTHAVRVAQELGLLV